MSAPNATTTECKRRAEPKSQRRPTDGSMCLGATHKWTTSTDHGAHWSVRLPNNPTPNPNQSSGHTGEVFSARFDPTGALIASGSMDRTINLWRTYGDCTNYGQLSGHKGAILDLHWSRDSLILFSASADTTLASWDLETGQRIRRHEGHEEIVNCMTASPRGEEILISGSDDGCVGIWDPRVKRAMDFIETDFPITSVAVAEAGNELYTGGIDCAVHAYDIRKKAVAYSMAGHTDTVTSLSVSPDSQSLLSYSHDGLARTWDIRPFAPVDRSVRTFAGAPVGVERNLVRASWDSKGERVGVGSGDGSVCVWESRTGKLIYKLPGHRGTVNDVRFAPGEEPISECPCGNLISETG